MSAMKLYALVLAGGEGRRFGGQKLLAPHGEGLLIEAALAAALAAPVERVFVVAGSEELAAAARAFAKRRGQEARLRVVPVVYAEEGLSVSLRAGLAALPPDAESAFIFLGDMPDVPHDLAVRLAQALEDSSALAAAPVLEGRRGHPVLLRRALFPLLGQLRGDRGAGGLLTVLGDDLAQVPVSDDGIFRDVDHPEDLGIR